MSMNDTETFLTEIRYPESFQEVVESLRLAMLAMKSIAITQTRART